MKLSPPLLLDISNRGYLVYDVDCPNPQVRDFNIHLFKEFFQAFANEVACNLHIRLEYGDEPHHVAEAIFKGFAKAHWTWLPKPNPDLPARFLPQKVLFQSNLTTRKLLMKKVGVIDYGTGNLRSVVKAFEFIGAEVTMVCRPEDAAKIEALVFPGQGTFDQCMGSLAKTGLDELIKNWIESDKPYFGICLGLQVLFSSSEEGEKTRAGYS